MLNFDLDDLDRFLGERDVCALEVGARAHREQEVQGGQGTKKHLKDLCCLGGGRQLGFRGCLNVGWEFGVHLKGRHRLKGMQR